MKPQDIKDLIDYISKSGLAEVHIETEEYTISVKKAAAAPAPAPVAAPTPAPAAATATPAPQPTPAQQAAPAPTTDGISLQPGEELIKSPMIGTFYRAPDPDSPMYVQEGDTIKPGQVVCIVEAMKLFNEIEAEIGGTVKKILVADATPVEFDQPLMIVAKS